MTKWREYFDATFLKAEEMSKDGETFILEHVDPGAVEEEETGAVKHQPVLIFAGGVKWGLNVTNRMLIEAMFGDEIEATVGKQITLYQTPCEVPGLYKGKPSIRILGSPELTKPMQVEITLRGRKGSRKPFTRTLVHTEPAKVDDDQHGPGSSAEAIREELAEKFDGVDPETGEPKDIDPAIADPEQKEASLTPEQINQLKAERKRLGMNSPDWHDFCKKNLGKMSAIEFTYSEAETAIDLLSLMSIDDRIGP